MAMFLSRLLLNSRSTQAWKDLSSPYETHRTILRAYPGSEAGGPDECSSGWNGFRTPVRSP